MAAEAYACFDALAHGKWVWVVLAEIVTKRQAVLIVAKHPDKLSISILRDAGVIADKRIRTVISMLECPSRLARTLL